jgi:environmental stress-induced protein Ves
MSLRYFERSGLAPMPWKNGGGVTREIVCYPPEAGMDDFAWRVSIATIATDGPFSVFNGIDRVITLLEGAGMRLRAEDGRFDHALDKALVPFAFPGEASVDCTLLAGESQDFNVMTRRAKLQAEVRVLTAPEHTLPCPHGLLMVSDGAWEVEISSQSSGTDAGSRRTITAGGGVWWSDETVSCRLSRTTADATMIAVRMVQKNDERKTVSFR